MRSLFALVILLFSFSSAHAAITPAFGKFSSAGGSVDASKQGVNTMQVVGATFSKPGGKPTMTVDGNGQTLTPADIITPYDPRFYMDGQSGRPTRAQWQAAPTTDVTAAVQAATSYVMSNGGRLRIPKGRYRITGNGITATWANHGIVIEGDGYDTVNGGSQLEFNLNAGAAGLTLAGASGIHPITIRNVAFVNVGSNSSYAIQLSKWRDANIEENLFSGWLGAGIYLRSLTYSSVNDMPEFNYIVRNYFKDNAHAIFTDLPAIHNIFIEQNRFLSGTDSAIHQTVVNDGTLGLSYAHHWVIRDNWFYPAVKSGLKAEINFGSAAKNFVIHGNYFEDNSNTGLPFINFGIGQGQHAGIDIEGNTFAGTPATGSGLITIGNTSGLTVGTNTVLRSIASNAGVVKLLDTSVTNFKIDSPSLPASVTVPTVYLDGSANAIGYSSNLDYQTTPYTPVLKFGSGSTGITTNYKSGGYRRVGNVVTVFGYFSLTSKGSSTGTATVSLPLPASYDLSTYGMGTLTYYNAFATGVTTIPLLTSAGGSSVATFNLSGAGSLTAMTDASFTNTTQFAYSITYITP